MSVDILGAAPWAIISAGASWLGAAYVHRDKRRSAQIDANHNLEIHKDKLTFELLQNAREEIGAARSEVKDLQEELTALRALEKHFYHFQQSLDHLEAILSASTQEDRVSAERSARAFLTRMRRLNEAKGALRNEVQRTSSATEIVERAADAIERKHTSEKNDD